jgi:hypothetical protein
MVRPQDFVDDPPVGGAGKIERGQCRKGCGNLGAEYKMPDRESSRLRRGEETRPEVVMGAGGGRSQRRNRLREVRDLGWPVSF